jgi:hypothetical protein
LVKSRYDTELTEEDKDKSEHKQCPSVGSNGRHSEHCDNLGYYRYANPLCSIVFLFMQGTEVELAANILNKQPRTKDKGFSSSMGVGREANNPSP